mgnify:CR=1 FL=1
MQIVTDRGADLSMEQLKNLNIHFAPLRIQLNGKMYVSGVDLSSEEFYELLSTTDGFPTTSQPSAGEFADLYRELAKTDPEILSIHISSGLSGTVNAAKAGAEMVPEAKITIWDTKTLSCPEGWQVEAAARAIKAGWEISRILKLLEMLREKVTGVFTLNELRYLVHGGRISHLKGLVASLLNIKPIIAVEKEFGKYVQAGREITIKRAIREMVNFVAGLYPAGEPLRIQILHGMNKNGINILLEELKQRIPNITWLPTSTIAPVLGAHTGPSIIGLSAGPLKLFEDLP